ncbi:MAG: DUF1611 domain-containing protein [Acidimicrobiales bacterium]
MTTDQPTPRWFRPAWLEELSTPRLLGAQPAFTTRRVPLQDGRHDWTGSTLLSGSVRPRPGDLVLAELTRAGHHRKLELPTGRRSPMVEGGEIIVAYGDRYAPDQFEGEVPADLGPTNLVASGGVAADVVSRHGGTRRPTEITPIGLLADASGVPLNLRDFALPPLVSTPGRPPVITVFGTSMNAGKTTAVASLVSGLVAAGERAGGTKVTGTGSGNDFWSMVDAGAHRVLDFTDAGLASTYKVPIPILEKVVGHLVDHLAAADCTVVVMEVADGIYQLETAQLLRSPAFLDSVDGIIFAAGDAAGAVAGVAEIQALGLDVLAVTGAFTRSPLAIREVEAHCPVPVLTRPELVSAEVARQLVSHCRRPRRIDLVDDHRPPSQPVPGPMDPSGPPEPVIGRPNDDRVTEVHPAIGGPRPATAATWTGGTANGTVARDARRINPSW